MSNITITPQPAVTDGDPFITRKSSSFADQVPLIIIGGSLGAILGELSDGGLTMTLALAALGAFAGRMIPSIRADRAEKARLRAIDREVSTVASLLAVTVKAGLGLDAAFETVAAETKGPLGEELAVVVDEVRVGKRRNEALRALQERAPTPDIRRLAQALHHSEELGGSVYDTLNSLAEDCRSRRFQTARAEAAKLPVKILFPVVFLIFPPMLIVLLGPAMSDIQSSF